MRLLKILAGLASLLLLGWASGYGRLQIALVVCLCRILGIRRLQSVLWITLGYIFVARPFPGIVPTHWPEINLVLRAGYGASLLADPAVKYFGLLARLALGYGLFRLLRPCSLRQKIMLLHLATFALILISGVFLESGPVSASVGMYFLISFCWNLPVLAYLTLDHVALSPARFASLYLVPFWETSPCPQPILDLAPQADEEDVMLTRSIRLALVFTAVIAGGNLIYALFFQTKFYGYSLPLSLSPLPDLNVTGLTNSLFLLYPRWQILLSFLLSGLHRITGYLALGVLVECCRLVLGYNVPQRFIFPWRANTFGEFYSCIMPYYVVQINRLYLQPIYTYLRSKGWNRNWGFQAAVCLAVFLANFTIHVLKDVQLVGFLGGSQYLWLNMITEVPYCLVLLFFARFMGLPGPLKRRLPIALKFLYFLLLYSTVILFRTGGIFVSLGTRLKFAGALFFGLGL